MKKSKMILLVILLPAVFVSGVYAAPLATIACKTTLNQVCVFVVNFPSNQNVTVTNFPQPPRTSAVNTCIRNQSISLVTQPQQQEFQDQQLCRQSVDGYRTVRIFANFSLTSLRISTGAQAYVRITIEVFSETDGIRIGPLNNSMASAQYSQEAIGDNPITFSSPIYFQFEVNSPTIVIVLHSDLYNVNSHGTMSVSSYATA